MPDSNLIGRPTEVQINWPLGALLSATPVDTPHCVNYETPVALNKNK